MKTAKQLECLTLLLQGKLTTDHLSQVVEQLGLSQSPTQALLDHVMALLRRHVAACMKWRVPPEVERTIVEGVEDFRLIALHGEQYGVAQMKAPDILIQAMRHFHQYQSPKDKDKSDRLAEAA